MNRLFTLLFLFIANLGLTQSIVWVSPCSDKSFCLNQGSCTLGNVFMTEQAVTNCGNPFINYSYRIDLNNNGSIDIQSSADTVLGNFSVGTHKVHWRATDNCGNINSCTYLFTIKDCNPPSLLCINGLTQSLDAPECMALFHANQFILNVSDNCTPNNQLEFAMRKFGTGTGFPTSDSVTYDKCDIGTNFIEIWVRDAAGLMNSCQNYVIVQPSQSGCVCNVSADVRLQSCVHTPDGQKAPLFNLKSTLVSVAGANTPITKLRSQVNIDSCATLHHENLPFSVDYKVGLEGSMEDQSFINGVSTFDLLQISKHILGIQPFQNFYQVYSADVNRNSAVTNFDILELRKLILGIYDTLPGYQSPWKFIRPVSNPANLTSFAQVKDTFQVFLKNLQVDTVLSNLNFIAIKIGDVNFNAALTGVSDDRDDVPVLEAWMENAPCKAGEIKEIEVQLAPGISLDGWQLSLQARPDVAQILEIQGLSRDAWHSNAAGTEIKALWLSTEGDQASSIRLKIKVLENSNVAEIFSMNNSGLSSEAYIGTERRPVVLRFIQAAPSASARFFVPMPNPFHTETVFQVWQQTAGDIRLDVFDVAGQLVYQVQEARTAGNQQLSLNAVDLPGSGLYIYRLSAGNTQVSGKIFFD